VADLDREVLFGNEAFALGMLQAVSGGSIVGSLAQADTIIEHAGNLSFLLLVTGTLLSLATATIAAYWRHQYKMWDVKAVASASQGQQSVAAERSVRSSLYLRAMRWAMLGSLLFLLFSLIQLVVWLWFRFICP